MLTPSTLNFRAKYRLQWNLIVEHMPFHMVKNVCKYSFLKRRYGILKMSVTYHRNPHLLMDFLVNVL